MASVFQPRINENKEPFVLDLEKAVNHLHCEAPSNVMIHHPHSCRQFLRDSITPMQSVNLNSWVMLKSFEVLFSKSYCNIWSDIATSVWEKNLQLLFQANQLSSIDL